MMKHCSQKQFQASQVIQLQDGGHSPARCVQHCHCAKCSRKQFAAVAAPMGFASGGKSSKKAVGFAMLGGTVVLWVASSVLVQMVFEGVHFEKPVFVTLFNSSMSVSFLIMRLPMCAGSRADDQAAKSVPFRSVLRLSSTLGLLWLCSQWAFNMSLVYTSVATNTVLSSTSSVFTFFFSIVICRDPFRWPSFCAAVFSFAGCTIVAIQAPSNISKDAVTNSSFGDVLVLVSSAMFAFVSVLLRKLAPG